MRGSAYRLPILLYLADLAIVLGSLTFADMLRHQLHFGTDIAPGTVFLSPVLYVVMAGLWTLFGWASQLYDARKVAYDWRGFKRILVAEFLCLVFFSAVLFLLKYQHFSRIIILYFCVLSLVSLSAYRLLLIWVWKRLTAMGYGVSNALIVGADKTAQDIARAIKQQPFSQLNVVGYVDETGSGAKPLVGRPDEITTLVDKMHIDEVIIALPPERRSETIEIVRKLQWSPVRLKLLPDFIEMASIRATAIELGGLPLVCLREPLIGGFEELIKRIMDIIISATALILGSPLMLLTALSIKLDSPGPVIYKHERIGENGKRFQLYKFRSMVSNADELLHRFIDVDKLEQPAFKIKGDPRVTRTGRIIRRLCLDELPQLWNVLKGEMSLVGPRPEITEMVKKYNSWQLKRLAVKPGLTGPMQVSGSGDLSLNERVKLELDYIENYSLWEDIKILTKTAKAVISGNGIY